MKNINERKGELTTQQIVMLIILVTSFLIILFLLFRLNLKQQTNDEICHNSVVLKAKESLFSKVTGGSQLDCRTSYVCISSGGACSDINPTKTVKVDPKNIDQTYKAIADEMANCWWMFGEGKIDYTSGYSGYHCAICSTIKFDGGLKENRITYDGLFEYLQKTKKTETQTYYQYLYPYFTKYDSLLQNFKYLSEKKSDILDLTQSFSVITGRNKEFNPNSIYPFVKSENNDLIIPAYFIKTSDITETGCTDFDITKA